MTHLQFWFDVGCPWTWLTSEWVRQIAPVRGIDVRWRVYSLTMRSLGDAEPEPGKSFTLGAARVLEAVWAHHGDAAVGALYEHIGRAVHVDKQERGPLLVAAALRDVGLDAAYADAADDARWDGAVRASMKEADTLAGADVAVPVLAIGEDPVRALSGPVLSENLPLDRALAVWDAVAALAAEPTFFELKRSRSVDPAI